MITKIPTHEVRVGIYFKPPLYDYQMAISSWPLFYANVGNIFIRCYVHPPQIKFSADDQSHS